MRKESEEIRILKVLVEEVNKCRYAWFSNRLLEAQKQASMLIKEKEVGYVRKNKKKL
jgi:hypothetical protein